MKRVLTKTVAYVSGTRADFGLMSGTLGAIRDSRRLRLHLYATGMHCMPEFGSTFREVKKAFPAVKKIDVRIQNDSPEALATYMADCVGAMTREFIRHKPDCALVLGDRAEMLATACACVYLGIPVVHVHGGDTSGTVDDVVRHTITKLSHVHLPATQESSGRIRRLGEKPWRIHVVGSPSLDALKEGQLLSKRKTYALLRIEAARPYILLTLHPEVSQPAINERRTHIVLSALETTKLPIVIVYPNADPGHSGIVRVIESKREHHLYRIYTNLPYMEFLSVAKYAAVWVGNSSAGIIESPSIHVPVVNVGARQNGRTAAKNIVTVPFSAAQITKAVNKSLTDKRFLRMIAGIKNPWGDGHTAARIVHILETLKLSERLMQK